MTEPDSYPYMHLAQRLGVPYRKVLALVEEFEEHPDRIAYWASLYQGVPRAGTAWNDSMLRAATAHAVFTEHERRKYPELQVG